MNFRIQTAGEILKKIQVGSVLDVGCRGCEAKAILPEEVEYFGNDLFQNEAGGVAFVGDVLEVRFDRTFDCVMALDIVEHVDDPYRLMDKLVSLTDKHLIVSLPNTYDLLHKYDFVVRDTLGKKYAFGTENSLDRHRWLMNYAEIYRFYDAYCRKHNMGLQCRDIIIGERSAKIVPRMASRVLPHLLGRKIMTRTVLAHFSK